MSYIPIVLDDLEIEAGKLTVTGPVKLLIPNLNSGLVPVDIEHLVIFLHRKCSIFSGPKNTFLVSSIELVHSRCETYLFQQIHVWCNISLYF